MDMLLPVGPARRSGLKWMRTTGRCRSFFRHNTGEMTRKMDENDV